MKKTLRIVLLTEIKENLIHDLSMLQDYNFVTTDKEEKRFLLQKIKYTKSLIEEVNQMIAEL